MANVFFIQELLEEFEQTAKGDAGRKIEKKRNAEVKSGKNAKDQGVRSRRKEKTCGRS